MTAVFPADETSPRQRFYEHLLLAYPSSYRASRGAEIVGTLMDAASSGQRSAHRREIIEVVAGGMRQRLGVGRSTGYADGLRIVLPVAVLLAVALSAGAKGIGNMAPAIQPYTYAWCLALFAWAVRPPAGRVVTVAASLYTLGYASAWSYIIPPVALVVASMFAGVVPRWLTLPIVAAGGVAVLTDLERHAIHGRQLPLIVLAMLAALTCGHILLRRTGPRWWSPMLGVLTGIAGCVLYVGKFNGFEPFRLAESSAPTAMAPTVLTLPAFVLVAVAAAAAATVIPVRAGAMLTASVAALFLLTVPSANPGLLVAVVVAAGLGVLAFQLVRRLRRPATRTSS